MADKWIMHQLKKEEERKQREQELEVSYKMSQEEMDRLNKSFGYPDPPTHVCAIGQPDKAAVWWIMPEDELPAVIAWEIVRYRRNMNGKEWSQKGSITIRPHARQQLMVENLSNGHEYKFTVKAINKQGPSKESVFSNAVVIESVLPIGWFRFFDRKHERFYYANLKTHQSSWTRPDLDPDFLDEEIIIHFNPAERKHMRALYDEEMHAFDCVPIERFVYCLLECGEKVPLKEVKVST